MKQLITAVVVLVIGLGILNYYRYTREKARADLARIQTTLEDTEARAQGAELRSEKFKRELLKLQAEQLLKPASIHPSAMEKTQAEHPAVKLFRDPEMREAMRREQLHGMQQRMRSIVDSNLVSALKLTPEQIATLEDLLRKKHTPEVDFLMGLMTSSAAELPEIGRAAQRQQNQADAEIRAFLGEEAYSTYKDHEYSLAERQQLARLRRDLEKTGVTISASEEAALLQAMIEERRNFPFTHNFHDQMSFDMGRLPAIYGEDSLNQFMNEMDQVNNRIILRAQSMLGVEQAGEFAQALRNQFEKSKMTVRMTAALFPVGGRPSP